MEPPFFWTTQETEKPVRFLLRLLGEGLLLTSIVYSCLLLVLSDGASAGLGADEETTVALDLLERYWFLLGVIAVPLVEIIFLQLIPIEIARRFSSRFGYRFCRPGYFLPRFISPIQSRTDSPPASLEGGTLR